MEALAAAFEFGRILSSPGEGAAWSAPRRKRQVKKNKMTQRLLVTKRREENSFPFSSRLWPQMTAEHKWNQISL